MSIGAAQKGAFAYQTGNGHGASFMAMTVRWSSFSLP